MVAATTAQWQLMRGHLAPALRWAQATHWEEGSLAPIRTSSDLVWRCEHLWITRAQVFIAQGRAVGDRRLVEEAQAHLIRQQAFAEATGLIWLRIKLLVLQAAAGHTLGEVVQATTCLQQALFLAESEGYVRIFVDEGEPIRLLLLDYQSTLKKQFGNGVDSESLRLLIYIDKLLAAFFPTAPAEKSRPATILEPLSQRELDILRLIATGRSNKEIAEILVIAVSTVKSHINNLYGKLGTKRRTQAIAIARDWGLLSE
jgi:LuxR family maltose regulon positive regulatory protein